MQITIKFFARFKEIAGTGQLTQDVPEQTTLAQLLGILKTKFSDLPLGADRTILSINQEFASPETVLHDGDEVAIFPPVSGGTASDIANESTHPRKFSITDDPISLDEVAQLVSLPQAGAIATFAGVVRDVSDGKSVSSLRYEAYHDMAIAKLKQIALEAQEKWPDVIDMAIVQRIGHLEVGEIAVIVAASSPHRYQGCFEACQYGINRLKEIVPVWKKEFGPDGAEWIEGEEGV